MTDKNKHMVDRETLILRKYKQPVIKTLKRLADEKKLAQLCRERFNNMAPARLTELHTGKRELTPYYLAKLVSGGIVNLETILQGRKMEDLPEEDQRILKKIFLEDDEVDAIWEAKERGFNIVALIRQLFNKK